MLGIKFPADLEEFLAVAPGSEDVLHHFLGSVFYLLYHYEKDMRRPVVFCRDEWMVNGDGVAVLVPGVMRKFKMHSEENLWRFKFESVRP